MKFAVAALLVASTSAECMKGIKMEMFTDKDCKTALEKEGKAAKHEITEDELKAMNEDCAKIKAKDADYWKSAENFEAKSIKTTCDTKALNSTVYADAKCEGDDTKSMTVEWGACKELKMGEKKMYLKVTGAMALQAAAAAALAFVGSQF